ncbi:ABC transporter permease subunit [Paenibacillus sp. MBLB4367]|uniref:ABC transporter permease subunit n=1 Tax=Paenibacillus sp. MBLB4367 TaxID=3384767 RepID=UPI00390811ED
MYEAARVDGANRWKQMVNITLPGIRSTIVVLLILRLGQVMDVGFEHAGRSRCSCCRDILCTTLTSSLPLCCAATICPIKANIPCLSSRTTRPGEGAALTRRTTN